MSLMVAPELVAAAAADLTGIGQAITRRMRRQRPDDAGVGGRR